MTSRRWVVHGRVQGVGYRWFVREVGRELGLNGWARNDPAGTVTVEARGPDPDLDRLEAALREGPRHASVTHVDITPNVDSANWPTGFEIRR